MSKQTHPSIFDFSPLQMQITINMPTISHPRVEYRREMVIPTQCNPTDFLPPVPRPISSEKITRK
jgi:hypothetical protein